MCPSENDLSIGHQPRGRPQKITQAILIARAELARNEQVAMNSIIMSAVLEAIAGQTALTNQRPFSSGVLPKHTATKVLEVFGFIYPAAHFIYLFSQLATE